jgi:hypothetical protein
MAEDHGREVVERLPSVAGSIMAQYGGARKWILEEYRGRLERVAALDDGDARILAGSPSAPEKQARTDFTLILQSFEQLIQAEAESRLESRWSHAVRLDARFHDGTYLQIDDRPPPPDTCTSVRGPPFPVPKPLIRGGSPHWPLPYPS